MPYFDLVLAPYSEARLPEANSEKIIKVALFRKYCDQFHFPFHVYILESDDKRRKPSSWESHGTDVLLCNDNLAELFFKKFVSV